MTDFSADWLRLRELADTRARSDSITSSFVAALDAREPRHIVDIGAGAGANLRFLAPRIPGAQQWLLVDHDVSLLERVGERTRDWCAEHHWQLSMQNDTPRVVGEGWECLLQTHQMDLASRLEELRLERGSVVTASALLDLVSERWLSALAARCREADALALFALTYDGRIELWPEEPEDSFICELVNRHQRGDKGFGPALGPGAAPEAARLFTAQGYRVHCRESDWDLQPDQPRLQTQLIEGWAQAASQIVPAEAARCESWLRRRLAHVTAARSRIIVGHQDLMASLR